MDMNASYQAFVHELFPNAELIIDRFHIIQLMGRTMDTIRTPCLKQLDKHSREYKVVAVELGHHIFDPCSKFIANLIGLTLEFSQN